MGERLTDRRVVWLALMGAYQQADSMCDAYGRDQSNEIVEMNIRFMKAFDRVAVKYYGKSITDAMNDPLKGQKYVCASEILRPK